MGEVDPETLLEWLQSGAGIVLSAGLTRRRPVLLMSILFPLPSEDCILLNLPYEWYDTYVSIFSYTYPCVYFSSLLYIFYSWLQFPSFSFVFLSFLSFCRSTPKFLAQIIDWCLPPGGGGGWKNKCTPVALPCILISVNSEYRNRCFQYTFVSGTSASRV